VVSGFERGRFDEGWRMYLSFDAGGLGRISLVLVLLSTKAFGHLIA
jgi:hypothetical protein